MRGLTILLIMTLALSSCGDHLGLGDLDCSSPSDDVSSSTVITVQAVPTAKYTPCVKGLRLGWDSVQWFAEDGRAGVRILKSFETFLSATVTESCDVSDAVAVKSRNPDIERFEDIELEPTNIGITIIPSGEQPLASGRALVTQFAGIKIDDRPVSFTLGDDIDESVNSRVDLALTQGQYVWIIDEVDAEEGTVQLRSNSAAAAGHGLQPRDALELIENAVPDVFYRGKWYFTFEGGCITYEFDATGILAETVAADAEESLGFFPAFELVQAARDGGFNLD